MNKEAKKEVIVCDGKDKDSTTSLYRICSDYQGGQVDGHFLKFEGDSLIATAEQNDDKSKIKLDVFQGDGNSQLWLITDPNSDRGLKYIIKDDGTSLFTVESLPNPDKTPNSYDEVIKTQFVFKKKQKKAGESRFYLYSYNTTGNGKSLVLAVGEDGHLRMNSPPELLEADLLNHDDSKYLFRIH